MLDFRGKPETTVRGAGFSAICDSVEFLVFQPFILFVERGKVGEKLPGRKALILLQRTGEPARNGDLRDLSVGAGNILHCVTASCLHRQQRLRRV